MRIILLQNIKGLGQIGEIKNVSDGYGKNFLLTRGLAKIATSGTIKEAEILKRKAETRARIQQNQAKELIESLKDVVLEIKRKSNEKGTLFDGIEAMDIAQALRNKLTLDILTEMIHLDEPIKRIGKHTVELELTPGVKTAIVIEVVSS